LPGLATRSHHRVSALSDLISVLIVRSMLPCSSVFGLSGSHRALVSDGDERCTLPKVYPYRVRTRFPRPRADVGSQTSHHSDQELFHTWFIARVGVPSGYGNCSTCTRLIDVSKLGRRGKAASSGWARYCPTWPPEAAASTGRPMQDHCAGSFPSPFLLSRRPIAF
jgi:hypothetical protein